MGVILVDLGDDKRDLPVNWWNWRTILSFLRAANLVEQEQSERMGGNACGGVMSEQEAIRAAAYLRKEIIPRLRDGERIHQNGEVSSTLEEPRPISSLSDHELYAAHKSCLESFASFCETCKGFMVY